jgi:tetratricopeptide (TPR) repeat protein
VTARWLALAFVWVAAAGAAAPLPLTAPPPDLTRLVPFVAAPLDKPPVAIPNVPAPAAPAALPPFPPAALVMPAAERPIAPLPPARRLPCIGAFTGVASEALECGRARFGRDEYEEAIKALEAAVRHSSDRELTAEARYWLGEALVRLGRVEQADWMFRQGAGDRPAVEHEVWAAHAGAWMALTVGDVARARDAFARLLTFAVPPPIATWGRHGLALAHYALGQYAEAERAWADLGRRGVPPTLVRDVRHWRGDTLGRLGDLARAEQELTAFSQGGAHPLLGSGSVRLGWWTLAAKKPGASVAALRSALAMTGPGAPSRQDRAWAEAGLALALAAAGDWDAAREAVRGLGAAKSPLAMPVAVALIRQAIDGGRGPDADALVQEMLAGPITPPVRGWLLLMKGDAHRVTGNRDEARTQYDLARGLPAAGEITTHALFRLARTNFEMREFAQAVTESAELLRVALPAEMRAAVLLLQAESSYRAGDYPTAETAFRRVVVELPQHAEVPVARLSLAWVAYRQGRTDDARRLFAEFARLHAEHPASTDALLVATELALEANDLAGARQTLDRIIAAQPGHPRVDFARLNRAILALRAGDLRDAQPRLRDWIARAPFPPLLGRAHVAYGVALIAANAPAEAAREFAAAQREGDVGVATLGGGVTALVQGRLDDATRMLTEARDSGTREVAATADYALGAVALARGQVVEFKAPAEAALRTAPSGPMAPQLLYVLTGIGVAQMDWTAALDTARRLVTEFPRHETADDALARIGTGAAAAQAWPVVYEAYTMLQARYPSSPFVGSGRIAFARAQVETGRAADARRTLEQATAAGADAETWLLLARTREATNDRAGAMEAYARAARDARPGGAAAQAVFSHARLLAADRHWAQARGVLEPLLVTGDAAQVPEVAFAIGETYRNDGQHVPAAEYYLTAAYLAPESLYGRRGLLAAAQSLVAAKHPDAAAVVYRKLLAQPDVPAPLADAARQGLQSLAR